MGLNAGFFDFLMALSVFIFLHVVFFDMTLCINEHINLSDISSHLTNSHIAHFSLPLLIPIHTPAITLHNSSLHILQL